MRNWAKTSVASSEILNDFFANNNHMLLCVCVCVVCVPFSCRCATTMTMTTTNTTHITTHTQPYNNAGCNLIKFVALELIVAYCAVADARFASTNISMTLSPPKGIRQALTTYSVRSLCRTCHPPFICPHKNTSITDTYQRSHAHARTPAPRNIHRNDCIHCIHFALIDPLNVRGGADTIASACDDRPSGRTWKISELIVLRGHCMRPWWHVGWSLGLPGRFVIHMFSTTNSIESVKSSHLRRIDCK